MSPSTLRGRPTVTTYEYDDQGRLTRSYQRSPWTDEDRALMIAWRRYQDSLCPGCGQPIDKAWHTNGWHEVQPVAECGGCTAQRLHDWQESGGHGEPPKPVIYTRVVDTRDEPPAPPPQL